jgi:hypothetical protein
MVPFDKPHESRGLFDIFVGNFKIVETSEETYLETPVYSNSSLSDSKDDPNVSTKSPLPFIFYIGTVISVGGIIFYFNRGKEPKSPSILKNNTNSNSKNKKTVSWADENDTINDGNYDSGKGSSFGTFLNNFQPGEPRYQAASQTAEDPFDDVNGYENIELDSRIRNEENQDYDFDIDNELESGDFADLGESRNIS